MSEQPSNPLASPEPWNLVAGGYEEITRKTLEKYSRSGLAMLSYGPQTRVVDVACGPGTTTLLLAPHVKQVSCLDFSAAMLDQLHRNVAAIGATNVEIFHGDGQELPFGEGTFDVGVSMFGLMFFPNRSKGFAELHRVLVPGGQVLVSSWAPSDQSPLMRTVLAALQPDDAPPQPMGRLSGLEDRDLFETEMRAAGFTDIHIRPVTHGVTVDDVNRFWEETVRAMAPITLLKRNSTATEWKQIELRALDRLRASLPDLPKELAATAYVASARKN
jgi:SAM-dependent methyltransferase